MRSSASPCRMAWRDRSPGRRGRTRMPPAEDRAHHDDADEKVAVVDRPQLPWPAFVKALGNGGGGDEAEPGHEADQDADREAGATKARAVVEDEAGEDVRHDEVADELDRQRRTESGHLGSLSYSHQGAILLAEQGHVPDAADDELLDRGDDDGPPVDAHD